MKVQVCIPSVRPDTVGHTIASIVRQTHSDWDLVVVGQGDDASVEAVTRAAAAADPRIRYLHLRQRGLSRARNAAIRDARADVIAFIDDDCEARVDWLAELARAFEDPEVALVGGALLAPPNAPRIGVVPTAEPRDAVYDPATSPHIPSGWNWVGGNFALRISRVREVGEFDDYLGPGTVFPAADDTDYRVRLIDARLKMLLRSQVVVFHTYGFRAGWKAMFTHKRGYALGYGAFAAKRAMASHEVKLEPTKPLPRLRGATLTPVLEAARTLRPLRVAQAAFRAYYVQLGYRRCLREYDYDHDARVLRPRTQPSAAASGNRELSPS